MNPLQDADPLQSPQYSNSESSLVLPKIRASPVASLAGLPYRRSNPSLSSLFASTASILPKSRSGSVTPTAPLVAGSVFSPGATHGAASPASTPQGSQPADEARTLILRSFVPHVGVFASADADELVQQKGLPGGFVELVRPFGERVHGKVTIRDSIGASRSWDDFGIRFTGLRDGIGVPPGGARRSTDSRPGTANGYRNSTEAADAAWLRVGGDVRSIEEVVDRHLAYAEEQSGPTDYLNHKQNTFETPIASSPFYALYLRRLLSGLPMAPHETFSHPVACVLAISSRSPSPIEELRRLYTATSTGDQRLPHWVNNEFLRYYVLVHDEDHDDISKSTSLFEQMKRHFGLHCHLLRLRTNQCVSSDEDCIRIPTCEWISASEELAEIHRREDISDPNIYLHESDAAALRTFVRELTTQSIVPVMERLIATWNEQVASRRRGISGRFMSLSKKWSPFSSSRTSSNPASSNPSNTNYDSLQGFYRPDSPEATMRKLADYAFMLRDFKLASSVYDLLRTDFNTDKAWKHYAAANEMCAVATLMTPANLSSKTRTENVDQMLESASYSFLSRCGAPFYALRTLAMGLELLKLRGSSAADDAARWATKALEMRVVGPVGEALFTERVSACYASRKGTGSMSWGSRRRKAAFWAVLAADSWVKLEKGVQAEKCLSEAGRLYGVDADGVTDLPFEGMRIFMRALSETVGALRRAKRGFDERAEEREADEETLAEDEVVEEISETLDKRPHRKSLVGIGAGPLGPLDTPLSPLRSTEDEPRFKDDQFE
ncbi:hypothetical protein W97_00293 [Coniosporium apollinis CBS 100218]|uniref:TRAPP complex protein TRS85 n=1 Tax=Coniosporium apollinis (strain CBS 100218) TaxID=1168221 RepID=R7YGS2_CONA1|nr:uncharacterized protein W97_00293 [Coniosporium apollinis CBS 100218]EON61082.1 hypothetical protein W97_00293 [Coniosporium apollinis CBS 100218]